MKDGLEISKPHPLFNSTNEEFKEVRSRILEYSIHINCIGESKLCRKTIKNCRLVCKNWLDITSGVLLHNREPLFNLTLDKTHFIENANYCYEDPRNQSKKLLLDLGNTVGGKTSPIAIKICPQYFQTFENHEILAQLKHAHKILVKLRIVVNQGNAKQGQNFNLDNQKFAKLKRFSVEFAKENPEVNFKLDPVFQACPNLQYLALPRGKLFSKIVLPKDFSTIIFPSNLTALDLSTKLESSQLQVLVQSLLPNLRSLTLQVHQKPFEPGLLFQVLENVRCSLECLFIQGENHNGLPKPPTYLSFPVMEKLTKLWLESQHLELEPNLCSLQTSLPKVTVMKLMLQTRAMLEKWTCSGSRLESVKKLYVTMTDDKFVHSKFQYNVTLEAEDMRKIHNTFPYLKSIALDFQRDENLDCLVVVFAKMTYLERLDIFVGKKVILHQDKWTATLLGLPHDLVPQLEKESFKQNLINNHPCAEYSILNLKNLKALTIITQYIFPLIADSVFEVAFFQMPKLRKFTILTNSQLASDKMARLWRQDGRIFERSWDVDECFDSDMFL